MTVKQVTTGLIAALLISAAIALFVSPKFDDAEQSSTLNAATVETDQVAVDRVSDEMRRNTVLSLRNDGHYWARAVVNKKTTVEFMVDTGASVVALSYRDAQRMGLKPDELDYRWTISTAGGETKGASVLIDSIRINQVYIRDIEAMVLRDDLEQSLLGMSFLSKLYSYEFRGDRLIIRQ